MDVFERAQPWPAGSASDLAACGDDAILSMIDRLFGAGLVLESVSQVVPSPCADRLQGVVEQLDLTIRQLRIVLCHNTTEN